MSARRTASPSVTSAANGGCWAGTNCGRKLVKKTAIFGLPRLLMSPCRSEIGVLEPWPFRCRAAALAPEAAQRVQERSRPEIDEIQAADHPERDERGLRRSQDRGEADARCDRPHDEAGEDTEPRRHPAPPPAAERVPRNERHVRTGNDDQQRRDREEASKRCKRHGARLASRNASTAAAKPSMSDSPSGSESAMKPRRAYE